MSKTDLLFMQTDLQMYRSIVSVMIHVFSKVCVLKDHVEKILV